MWTSAHLCPSPLRVAQSFSCVWLSVTSWTVAHQAPLSLESSRQECWSGLPFSFSRGTFPTQGSNLRLLCPLHRRRTEPSGKPCVHWGTDVSVHTSHTAFPCTCLTYWHSPWESRLPLGQGHSVFEFGNLHHRVHTLSLWGAQGPRILCTLGLIGGPIRLKLSRDWGDTHWSVI